MKEYSKHQIRRYKDLNDMYFELVFQRGDLKFAPGDQLTLYNYTDKPSAFIASGINEVWTRLILNRQVYKELYNDLEQGKRSIKINRQVINTFPDLITKERPSFIFDSSGIGPFFSYISTYPSAKCKVYYVGDHKIQKEWIRGFHQIVDKPGKLKGKISLYITGTKDIIEKKCKKLLAAAESYLYE